MINDISYSYNDVKNITMQAGAVHPDANAVAPARAGTTALKPGKKPELRRDAMRGNDLIGGAAGDLGHAVELPGETAGARRRRPQLHDQLADLGFRHHGADAIPPPPAPAGVKAEDLPAPSQEEGI